MDEKILTEQMVNNSAENVNVAAGGIVVEEDKATVVKRQRKFFSAVGIRYFILTIVIMVAQLLAMNLVAFFAPDFYARWTNAVSLLPITVVGLPVAYLLMKKVEKAPVIEQKFKFGVKQLIPFFFIAYAVMTGANIISTIINMVIAAAAQREATTVVATMLSSSDILQNTVMVVILAPILEEFLFRKFLIDRFSRFGEGVAVLVSALMFGFYHGNIVQFIYATALGLVLGYVYAKSRKVVFTILIHVFVNFLGSTLPMLVLGNIDVNDIMEKITSFGVTNPEGLMKYMEENAGSIAIYYGYSMFVSGIVIAGIVLGIITLVRHIKRKNMLLPGAEKLVKGKRFATIVGNVGMILFIVIWTGMMIFTIIGSYFV